MDGDGVTDLFISNWDDLGLLLLGGNARFTSYSGPPLGNSTVGAAFVDYDNDGDLDLVTTSLYGERGGDRLFQNQSPGLVEVGDLLGLRSASAGRALGYGDYDGDGDQDLLIADAVASQLYRNNNAQRTWIEVDLDDPSRNRQAIGAQVRLRAGGREQVCDVQPANGYGSQRPATVHFGLGLEDRIEHIEVRWPDGSQSSHDGLLSNRRLRLTRPAIATAVVAAPRLLPEACVLQEPYPNPFNGTTTVRFELRSDGPVRLEVFAVIGQRVRVLLDSSFPAGAHAVRWDARDSNGRTVASGVYQLRLTTPEGLRTASAIVVR